MMVYRKGTVSKRQVDQDWPHQVWIKVPERGLPRIMEMEVWCRRFDGYSRSEYSAKTRPDHFSVWCFRTTIAANDFHAAFGGQRIDTSA